MLVSKQGFEKVYALISSKVFAQLIWIWNAMILHFSSSPLDATHVTLQICMNWNETWFQ